jgi:hypothetical protein
VARVSSRTAAGWIQGVKADLGSRRVRVEVLFTPKLTPVWSMLRESQPVAAITGTFFAWETQMPVAEVLVDGSLVSKGRRGSVLGVRWDGRVEIRDIPFGRAFDWTPYRYGLRGAVRLMTNGEVDPDPRAQKFRDPAIWGRAPRTGVGLTPNGKLILAATSRPMTLSQFGKGMKSLGAVDALSLDGGGSTMLYHDGKMVVRTGRRLSSLLAIHQAPAAEVW